MKHSIGSAIIPTAKDGMTAVDFLDYAGWEGDTLCGLELLGLYLGHGSEIYKSYPDLIASMQCGTPISDCADEPAGFQEYVGI